METRFDVAVIGGGMAGASLAAEIVPHARVLVLEAEAQPGYHATGRSAAFWMESYGGAAVRPLTTASGPFLAAPPPEWGCASLVSPLGCLHIADRDGAAALEALADRLASAGVRSSPVERGAIEAALPGLRSGWDRAILEPGCVAIDVAGLHAGYLAALRRAGGTILVDAALRSAERVGGRWRLATAAGNLTADILVDAAGAWADPVARIAGAAPLGIAPYRRTMVQVRVAPRPSAGMPLVIDAAERFYFKPEGTGRLWLSPHDEAPVQPGDAAPEEIDVARAIASLESVVDWRVEAVERRWAGLRTFAPDRAPVYGFDSRAPGFFWFAGQGGFGIQTAPAAAKLGAAQLLGRAPDPMVAQIDPTSFSPVRFG